MSLKRKHVEELPEHGSYSQPADTGSAATLMSKMVYAKEYLKLKDRPISYSDIWSYLSPPSTQQHHRAPLREALLADPRVEYEAKGLDGQPSFRYRPIHNVRSAEELKRYLQIQPTAQGISVRELKDGWPSAIADIDALELKGEILVTRNQKDNSPKMVWANDPSLSVHIEADFQNIWHKIRLPANPTDMRTELQKARLTPTSQVKESQKVLGSKLAKKRINRKPTRSTNNHMAHILKDYSNTKR